MPKFDNCNFGIFDCLGQQRWFDEEQLILNNTMAREPVIINVYDMVSYLFSLLFTTVQVNKYLILVLDQWVHNITRNWGISFRN